MFKIRLTLKVTVLCMGLQVCSKFKKLNNKKGNNEFKLKWRRDLINGITKDRVVDQSLRKQIESDKIYICERHFSKEQLWIYESKKSLKDGVIPSLNLPVKTVFSPTQQRSTSAIEKREESSLLFEDQSQPPSVCY